MSSLLSLMTSKNPNAGIFEALDTYKTPEDKYVPPEILEMQKKDNVKLRNNLFRQSLEENVIPEDHIKYLKSLKANGFEPRVIYDIGSCILHWSKEARKIWPDAKIIAFDASTSVEFLYNKKHVDDYSIGILTNEDDKELTFYQHDAVQTGNSYYKEIGGKNSSTLFNKHTSYKRRGMTLDTIVTEREFPLPDLVKIDVQGAEKDVVEGGVKTILNCKHLIVEMQREQYNEGAPLVDETLPYIESVGFHCRAPLFCDNGADGDYGFERLEGEFALV